MLLENGVNPSSTALANLYTLLHSSAARSYAYTRNTRMSDAVLIQTVADLAAMSASTMRNGTSSQLHRHHLLQRPAQSYASRGPESWPSAHAHQQRQKQCLWLACRAYYDIFHRRQTGHAVLLAWLMKSMEESCAGGASQRALLETVVKQFEHAVWTAATG